MAVIDIKVPNIGDFAEVGVIEVLVQAGDSVAVEQSLITVESDKASMDIPSSHAGVVKSLLVKVGDKVAEGSVVLTLEASAATAANPPPLGEGRVGAGTAVAGSGLSTAAVPPPLPAPNRGGRGTEAPVPATSNVSNTLPWLTLSPSFTASA